MLHEYPAGALTFAEATHSCLTLAPPSARVTIAYPVVSGSEKGLAATLAGAAGRWDTEAGGVVAVCSTAPHPGVLQILSSSSGYWPRGWQEVISHAVLEAGDWDRTDSRRVGHGRE